MKVSKRQRTWIKILLWGIFLLYIVALAYFLFFSERYGRSVTTREYRWNLTLFKEINRFIKYREVLGFESFAVNIIGNIFAFAPFGFFLPMLSRRNRKLIHVLLLSFELSLVIEVLQLGFKVGCFDVDDLLMNTIGGVIGYILFAIVFRCMKGSSKR